MYKINLSKKQMTILSFTEENIMIQSLIKFIKPNFKVSSVYMSNQFSKSLSHKDLYDKNLFYHSNLL